jgi:Mce-associated membrane protein
MGISTRHDPEIGWAEHPLAITPARTPAVTQRRSGRGDSAATTPATRAPRRTDLLLVGALVLAAATGLWATHSAGAAADRAHDQSAATAAARRVALGLVDLDHVHGDKDIQALVADSTGPFANQLSGLRIVFAAALRQNEVVSTGEIAAAGTESLADHDAVVLVAAAARLRNKLTDGAIQPRQYRLRMTLTKQDGRWLVAKVEFVA